MPKAKPATRDQVARYGHVAAALRAAMKERGWGMPEFNEALGRPRGDAGLFKWVNGTGAPNALNRALIAQVTGIPEARLVPREPGDPPPPPAVAVALQAAAPAIGFTRAKLAADVLAFNVSSTGEARIRLDVSMPVARAMPLLRMLLDAGLVFTPGEEGG